MFGWNENKAKRRALWEQLPECRLVDGDRYIFPFGVLGKGYVVDTDENFARFQAERAALSPRLPKVFVLLLLASGIALVAVHFSFEINWIGRGIVSALVPFLVIFCIGFGPFCLAQKFTAPKYFQSIPAPVVDGSSRSIYFANETATSVSGILLLLALALPFFLVLAFTESNSSVTLDQFRHFTAAIAIPAIVVLVYLIALSFLQHTTERPE